MFFLCVVFVHCLPYDLFWCHFFLQNASLQTESSLLKEQLKQLDNQNTSLNNQMLALQRHTTVLQEQNSALHTQTAKQQVNSKTGPIHESSKTVFLHLFFYHRPSNGSHCVSGGELHALLPECISHGPECCATGPSHRLGDWGRVVAGTAWGGVAGQRKCAQRSRKAAQCSWEASARVRAAHQSAHCTERQTEGAREWAQDTAEQVSGWHKNLTFSIQAEGIW